MLVRYELCESRHHSPGKREMSPDWIGGLQAAERPDRASNSAAARSRPGPKFKMADLRCARIDLDEFGHPVLLINDEIKAVQP